MQLITKINCLSVPINSLSSVNLLLVSAMAPRVTLFVANVVSVLIGAHVTKFIVAMETVVQLACLR